MLYPNVTYDFETQKTISFLGYPNLIPVQFEHFGIIRFEYKAADKQTDGPEPAHADRQRLRG